MNGRVRLPVRSPTIETCDPCSDPKERSPTTRRFTRPSVTRGRPAWIARLVQPRFQRFVDAQAGIRRPSIVSNAPVAGNARAPRDGSSFCGRGPPATRPLAVLRSSSRRSTFEPRSAPCRCQRPRTSSQDRIRRAAAIQGARRTGVHRWTCGAGRRTPRVRPGVGEHVLTLRVGRWQQRGINPCACTTRSSL